MKRILSTMAMALATAAMLSAQSLTILHVNDTHSHFEPVRSGADAGLGGVIERAAYIDSVRKADGKRNVLLLHGGDFSQGTSYFTKLGGDLEVDVINAMGYDCITLGNHEFDNGIEELGRRLAKVECPVVCANYDFSPFEMGKYVKPYAIVKKAGMKIGIVGLLTDIKKVVSRTIVDRIPALDPVEAANKWAAYLKEQEHCDMVILLSHIGYDGDCRMIPHTKDIDLVIGGHSHTFLEKMESAVNSEGRTIPIVQDGCWGLYMGQIDIR